MHPNFAPTAPEKPIFETIKGDAIGIQKAVLSNGLTLFMAPNKDEPRVWTEIVVRAGSKHDPADATGLAHYFEHMMFKGTDRLGALDWAAEKPLLDRIEQLFEQHRSEKNAERKALIYNEIDQISGQAARFVAANEYDKLVSSLGAKNTNAYTWVEQTVYVNDIPTTALENWFALEAERFRRPVLRLFHTELETIFEEFNISQDKDFRKALRTMMAELFPKHPYGTQTTLGRGEDLKNPSQTKVYEFFDRFYVPNNMAIILAGDFEPEDAVRFAETTFGKMESKAIPAFKFEKQPAIKKAVRRQVFGQEAEWVEVGWRLGGAKSREAMMVPVISGLLYNQQAGLFDLHLKQKQLVLEAYSYARVYEDFTQFGLYAKPREGQTLAEAENLMLAELEKLKNGDFEDWLIEAVVNDLKLSEIKHFEKNQGRAEAVAAAFILGIDWREMISRWKKLSKITKTDVQNFVEKWLAPEARITVEKKVGADDSVMKVEKPPLTAIELNRADASDFAQDFLAKKMQPIEPQFVDYQRLIKKSALQNGLKIEAVRDPKAQLFRLHFIWEMGRNADRRLGLLANYLKLLGTEKQTAAEFQQAFFRLGAAFSADCQDEKFYLTLSGLEDNFEKAVALFFELLENAAPNVSALEGMISDVFVRRENAKKDKQSIVRNGLGAFGKYGAKSSYNDVMTAAELRNLRADELIDLLGGLFSTERKTFYFGKRAVKTVADILKKTVSPTDVLQKPKANKVYRELETTRNQVFFVDFPSVQVELLLVSKGASKFEKALLPMAEWYNQYFGYGLSSIVFQEIRESKALAYAAYAFASSPAKKDRAHWLTAYVGTQPDKLQTAVAAFQEILEKMPVSEAQIETARQSILQQMAAERTRGANIFWSWQTAQARGLKTDVRRDVFETLGNSTVLDLVDFQMKNVKGRPFTWLVLGEKSRVDFEFLKTIGPVKELSLEQVFGY